MRAVALVNVEVDDHRASDPTVALQGADRDGDIVEHTEAFTVVGERMVRPAGEVHRQAPFERGRGGLTRSTDSTKRALDQGLGPGEPDATQLRIRQRPCRDRVHIPPGVHEQERIDRRALGLVQVGWSDEPSRHHRVAKQGVLRDRKPVIGREGIVYRADVQQ